MKIQIQLVALTFFATTTSALCETPEKWNCFTDVTAECNDGTVVSSSGSACISTESGSILSGGTKEDCLDDAAKDAWADVLHECSDHHGGTNEATRQFANEEARLVNDC